MTQKNIKFLSLDHENLMQAEWLVANGLSGFSSSTVSGAPLRRYHGLLIAALPAPFGRTVMFNHLADSVVVDDHVEYPLSLVKRYHKKNEGPFPLLAYSRDEGLPVWQYKMDNHIIEKRISMIHRQNTVQITYQLIEGDKPVVLKWRPFFHFRTKEQPVNFIIPNESYSVRSKDNQYEVDCPNFPILRILPNKNSSFIIDKQLMEEVFYEIEDKRGYESTGFLTSPGYYFLKMEPSQKISFLCSTESWETLQVLSPDEAQVTEKIRRKNILKNAGAITAQPVVSKLVLAADQFVFTPYTRVHDMIRLQAAGEEVKSIIAGFPWFTDWGRDTMISLEGLTLLTGQFQIAHSILRTYAFYIKDGLIPNMFPEGENTGIYNTADATLWFFHAVSRYMELTGDHHILEFLLPKFKEIIDAHIRGTLFGIKVDQDGLLTQGQEGYALTWMDAKVGDWVVTPRRGKAVEINALWYNALRLMETWTGKPMKLADKCYESFNERFWYPPGGYLYDIVDGERGDDPAMRPNQLFAISLPNPVLAKKHWKEVVDICEKELLTSYGLRTLAPSHNDYKPTYDGDLRARDAAYHQGTVWPWLIGPFIDAWLKVYPKEAEKAAKFLTGLEDHLNQSYTGSIEEIFDAEPPYHARGCTAQAWSIAEFLRAYLKTRKK